MEKTEEKQSTSIYTVPELLAPCGSMEALTAAVRAGADAVYFGGTLFNARMHAKNFSRDEIRRAAERCHEAGVRCYVTLNTLLLDRQMREAAEFAFFLYEAGIDALILTDLGLASLLRRELPDLPLHASTQLSGHNADAAAFFSARGFSRMVCARELSGSDLRRLCEASPIGIECFVHGALCVSHSGQCLLSAVMGGRSGNRGECAGPCRLPYNGRYPLSLKDLCLAGHLRELRRTGVCSLKIEGRMKSPAYVASTVSVYRRLLDEDRDASPEEIARLAGVFSRSGFTDGYFTGKISPAMLGVRRESDKEATLLTFAGTEAETETEKKPSREPLPPITVDRPSVTPPAALFTGALSRAKKGETEGDVPGSGGVPRKDGARILNTARFYRPECIPEKEETRRFFSVIYLPLDRFDPRKANGVLLPPVMFDREKKAVRAALLRAIAAGASHLMLTNPGQLAVVEEAATAAGKILSPERPTSGSAPSPSGKDGDALLHLHGDFRLGCCNSLFAEEAAALFESLILSPELILPQIRDIPGNREVIVYGRLPLMLLEKPVGTPLLRDRKGSEFPILREGGRELLINSLPLYMADRPRELAAAGIRRRHFLFTVEGPRETEAIIDAYRKGLPTKRAVRRIK